MARETTSATDDHRIARLANVLGTGGIKYEDLRIRFVELFDDSVAPADPIAVIVPNTDVGVAALAALHARPSILLPPALTWPEIHSMLLNSRTTYLVVPGSAGVGAELESWRELWSESGIRLIARHRPASESPLAGLDVLCQVTSGTTGPSRVAVRPLDGVLLEADTVGAALDLGPGDRVVCCSSIAHSYALIGGLLASLRRGAEVVLAPSAFEAAATVRAAEPMVVFGLPATYRALVEAGGAEGLSRVRLALCAGAPLDRDVFDAFFAITGIAIRQDYGTTETGTIALDLDGEPGPEIAGLPLPHIEVMTGAAAQPDEVLVRSPVIAAAYVEAGELVPALDAAGWYHTGDLGRIGDDPTLGPKFGGRIRLHGRVRDDLMIRGTIVRLAEVEAAIRSAPLVTDVIALPAPLSSGGVGVRAIVVAPPEAAAYLEDWCGRHVPRPLRPDIIEVRDRLPYSPAGKLLRKYL